ncbi:MAG: outer membrane lipoprotein-sorting protein [Gemmatimonadota bacterium]|nr:MAG: outer membrane lipoprotein-sorting protein [Gemmatimonadota bacterium]
MSHEAHRTWVRALTHLATRSTKWTLLGVGVVTLVSLVLARGLQLKMNWTDLLPPGNRTVSLYRDILERFGEASIVVALEGERDAIVAMAQELEPRLNELESLHNVIGRLPSEFLLDHGFALLKPEQFDRTLETFQDWTLSGVWSGINDDYEREYTDSESNLRRDEVEIARGLLGITRALELLSAATTGDSDPATMSEAADALSIGDPWVLSLDRRMLLISLWPKATTDQIDAMLATVEEVEAVIEEAAQNHPDVYASTTGMGKISQDEMNSVGGYTVVLSLIALLLIYLLLYKAFRGWMMPMLALTPLVIGIVWTMGTLEVLFGSLNLMTAMMMLVLLGIGIDFSIHVISRFKEEIGRSADLASALAEMLSGTGVAVIIGAVTTALAFFTLMVGETRGVFEFGAAAGLGVLLTLLAILFTLPALLVLRYRKLTPDSTLTRDEGYRWIGTVAAAGWRRPAVFLAVSFAVVAGSAWAVRHTAYEYDFLELEAKGLRSVELQREIPQRFGISDHSAWLVAPTVEQSRLLKEEFRRLPEVGEVNAISDFIPASDRLATYGPKLERFRNSALARSRAAWSPGDIVLLTSEIDRLWENLDVMSNLAFFAGLDRIVNVIDRMTGVDSETGETDQSALLPTLSRQLQAGVPEDRMRPLAEAWAVRLKSNLQRMANPAPIGLAEVPDNIRNSFVPKTGDGYLVHLVPRRYLWDRTGLERFANQTEAVDPDVVGTEKLILVMMDETLADGRAAAILALAVIALLLMLHFRGALGLLALIPLAVGTLAMLGLMYLLGMKYNYMNLIATPIILGIGIDDGVHALHRYREERGTGQQRVSDSFRFVGKAILLTSVTTMIGFGSVGLYEMRGMASFGQVLFLGVGACFLATAFVLPAVLRVLSGRTGHRDVVDPSSGTAMPSRDSRESHEAGTTATPMWRAGILLIPILTLSLIPSSLAAQSDGAEWLAGIEAAERVPHSYSVMKQTITTSGGSLRTFTIRSWTAANGDLSLMAYTDPPRVAGDRILQLDGGDLFWYYMKRRDVTRQFAGHNRKQSAMGSDFSYEDLAMGDLSEDYAAELLGYEEVDGVESVKLHCTPTESGPSYDHLILWAGVADSLTRRIEYYDEEHHLKTLYLTEIRAVEGRKVAFRLEMVNHREGSKTVLEMVEVTFAGEPEASLFTKSALTRPLPRR